MKLFIYIVIFFICCSISCSNRQESFSYEENENKIKVALEIQTDSLFFLKLWINDSLNSTWELKYPVYKFDYGDVTGTGIPDVAVGVIKPTRYDLKSNKRLFLFRITENHYIRPLWLGSRVSQPLDDFRVINSEQPSLIRTVEKEQNGTYLVAEYKWRGFGLEHIRYLCRETDKQHAIKLLNEN